MELGTATLRALAEADRAGVKVAAPRYDKSANGGRGDRADAASWPTIEGPVQVKTPSGVLHCGSRWRPTGGATWGWACGHTPASPVLPLKGAGRWACCCHLLLLPSAQVVLFEGWMLGFSPVSTEAAAAVSPELVPVNDKLREYEQAWDSYCAAWLVIQVQDYNWVQKWRLQVIDQSCPQEPFLAPFACELGTTFQ